MTTLSQGGIRFYQHSQTSAASTWTVTHDFGQDVSVEITAYDGGVLKRAFPVSIVVTNSNTLTIHWSSARTGFARVATTATV